MTSISDTDQSNFRIFNVKDELQHLDVDSIREWQSCQHIPFSLAMYNTVRDFNLASVIRNACAFGLETIYIIGHRKWDKRGAVGAYHYVDICYIQSFEKLLSALGSDRLVAMELPEHYPDVSESFIELDQFAWNPGQCILVGEEGAGIPPSDLESCQHRINITIPGSMRSLNVATSAGIAMYSMSRSFLQTTVKENHYDAY